MNIDERLAEEVRLVYRHLYWAKRHLSNIYNAVKPEDRPALEVDPRQLSLFGNESEEGL